MSNALDVDQEVGVMVGWDDLSLMMMVVVG
jgi:hypothetical protein